MCTIKGCPRNPGQPRPIPVPDRDYSSSAPSCCAASSSNASPAGSSGANPRSSSSSILILPRKNAPSSVEKAIVTTSPHTRPALVISTRCAVMFPFREPEMTTVLARICSQVTRPCSPMCKSSLRIWSRAHSLAVASSGNSTVRLPSMDTGPEIAE